MAVSDIRTILFDLAPELETAEATPLARVNRFIGYAEAELLADVWATAEEDAGVTADSWYNMAAALLAAHKLTLGNSGPNAPAGPVVSEKVGQVSTTYANPTTATSSASGYDATSYGRQYTEFRLSVLSPAMSISGEALDGLSETDVDTVE